jgi:hypothetical protein
MGTRGKGREEGAKRRTRDEDPLLERRLEGHVLDHANTLENLVHQTDSLVPSVHLDDSKLAKAAASSRGNELACPERWRKPSTCSG